MKIFYFDQVSLFIQALITRAVRNQMQQYKYKQRLPQQYNTENFGLPAQNLFFILNDNIQFLSKLIKYVAKMEIFYFASLFCPIYNQSQAI